MSYFGFGSPQASSIYNNIPHTSSRIKLAGQSRGGGEGALKRTAPPASGATALTHLLAQVHSRRRLGRGLEYAALDGLLRGLSTHAV